MKRGLIVIGGVCLLLLVGARLHLKWKVHRAVAGLRASGQAVRMADLHKKYARVPDEENAAILLTEARKRLAYPADSEKNLIPVVGNYDDRGSEGGRWPEEVLAATRQYLDQQEPGMELAMRGLQRPRYWVEIDGAAGGDGLSFLADGKFIVSLLSLRVRHDVQTKKWEEIPPLLEAQVRIGNLVGGQPSLIDQMVRMAYYAIALFDLERYLNASALESGDLSLVSSALRQATDDWRLDRTVEWERVEALEPIYWKSEELPLNYELDFTSLLVGKEPDRWGKSLEQMKVILYRSVGAAELDLLYLLDAYEGIDEASSESLKAIADLSAKWSSIRPGSKGQRYYYWSEMFLSFQERAFAKWVETHTKLRAATAAVAVTEYRIDHDGKLPGSLEELVPDYLTQVPLEPRTEKPLELTETGYGFGIGRGAPVFSVRIPHE